MLFIFLGLGSLGVSASLGLAIGMLTSFWLSLGFGRVGPCHFVILASFGFLRASPVLGPAGG